MHTLWSLYVSMSLPLSSQALHGQYILWCCVTILNSICSDDNRWQLTMSNGLNVNSATVRIMSCLCKQIMAVIDNTVYTNLQRPVVECIAHM